jgi:hypothetical protein
MVAGARRRLSGATMARWDGTGDATLSRAVSATMRASMFAQETSEVYLVLLKVDHPDLATPLYFVNAAADVTSNAILYTAIAFDVSLPADVDDELPKVKLTIDNVERTLVPTISQYSDGLTVAMSVVLASDPDTVEIGPFTMTVQNISFDAQAVVIDLGFSTFLDEAFPAHSFTPIDFPGLF